ncbi:right-handed parallel beta-helix repeat-containing protein [Xanthomonas campestris]|uniref:right-handed parallel beta-helix repeat-containing protein n=1 Tax=Xanthomonas campestris TaxID=339 RepID=UPI003555D142
MRMRPSIAWLMVWLALAGVAPHAAAAPVYRLYLAPDGDDTAAGTSAATALRSLAAVQQRLIAQRPATAVDVIIAAGTYERQTVQWHVITGAPLRFIAAPDSATSPVFDGRGAATWFTLRGGKDAPTRVTFAGLTIRNYWMALDLGSSKRSADGNSDNVIRDMRFERIGGVHGSSPEAAYAFAAIRLQNSRNNRIEHNHFSAVENAAQTAGYVHALYLARSSSGNRIEDNSFTDISGDAIRTRDRSDATLVQGNRFIRAGKYAAFSDWFKTDGECPSQGGQFIGNTVGQGYQGPVAPTRTTGADDACGPLQRPRIEARATLRDD